jgi:selenide,water dikinase
MQPDAPVHTDIVLIGGGHAHVAVLKRFGMKPIPGVRLNLISPSALTPYSGMLPGYLAGHYTLPETHLDLGALCRFAGARFYRAKATGLDLSAGTVKMEGRPAVGFDWVSLDIGSTPSSAGIEGAGHAVPIKPVDRFLARWRDIEAGILESADPFDCVVVGAGAGGTEAALALTHRVRRALAAAGAPTDRFHMSVVSLTDAPLPEHGRGVRRRLRAALDREAISFHGGYKVVQIEADRVLCDPPLELRANATILATPAAAAPWLAETGLALDERGFVRVGPTLQSVSDPRVFAAGDIAAFEARPLPKSGVYAVRAGPVLADSLRRVATGRPAKAFRPQRRTLALVSMGRKRAVLSYGPLSVEGDWAWRFKNWIDRRWMRQYSDLPDMAGDDPNAEPMRCGGCGAKVPADILRRALARLPKTAGPDVLIGLDAPDDAVAFTPAAGKLMVQTVDQFRDFIGDPYLFGRITANHCLGDIYAMGAEPVSALATVILPYADAAKVEQDLEAVLAGSLATFADAGVTLLGGHTGEGAELSLGFTINGVAVENHILRKGGMRPGDALILTKPIGTGALLAADMRHEAAGADIEAALACMLQSNRDAAEILRRHGATAATDVTGFGLFGHLAEMAAAAGVSIKLEQSAVPVLAGAAEVLEAGIESSLHTANEFSARALLAPGSIAGPVLFDPQTAGGLLAAVPRDAALACIAALCAAGYGSAAIIGAVIEAGAAPAISIAAEQAAE